MARSERKGISVVSQLVLVTFLLLALASITFTTVGYFRQRRILLSGIDQKLLVAADLAHAIPPAGYFDAIEDKSSVTPELYRSIVDRHNKLCLDLDLQYLWSCMLLNDQVVFTTATSPSKDVTKGDHAGFLDKHGDPAAFDTLFSTMSASFLSFENEWGHGRMVLLPFTDAHGRKYCVGASVGINEIHALTRHMLWTSVIVAVLVSIVGLLVSLAVSLSLARPIRRLTDIADHIAHGDMSPRVEREGSRELKSLADSISSMRDSVREKISALEVEVRERQAAEAEVARHRDHLEELVQQRTDELRRSNHELEQFAYVASHDLQEPLRKIQAFSDGVLRQDLAALPEKARDYLARMANAANRMQRLIEDLLLYSRVTTKAKPSTPVDLGEVAEEVIADLEVRVRETGATIEIDPLPVVAADATQMRQLLQNLLSNALKFRRPDERPVIRMASPGPAPPHAAFVTVEVEDNGIGFDAQYAERIFDVFERLHTRDEYPGSGVGLAICRRIVERHGGRITAQSRPGKGTTFTFTLPLA